MRCTYTEKIIEYRLKVKPDDDKRVLSKEALAPLFECLK